MQNLVRNWERLGFYSAVRSDGLNNPFDTQAECVRGCVCVCVAVVFTPFSDPPSLNRERRLQGCTRHLELARVLQA